MSKFAVFFFPLDFGEVIFFPHIFSSLDFSEVSKFAENFSPLDFGEVIFFTHISLFLTHIFSLSIFVRPWFCLNVSSKFC